MQVIISVLRLLLFVARPRTFVLGNIPNSVVYRNVEQYPNATHVPGILILEIDSPIYFANASYLRERYILSLLQILFRRLHNCGISSSWITYQR